MSFINKTVKLRGLCLVFSVSLLCSGLAGCRQMQDTEAAHADPSETSGQPETETDIIGPDGTYSVLEETLLSDSGTESYEEVRIEETSEQSCTEPASEQTGTSEAEPSAETDPAAAFKPVEKPAYIPCVYNLIPGSWLIKEFSLRRPVRSLRVLKYRLDQILSSYEGTWSVCVKDLSTYEQFVINDIPMPSASLMKLFILGCIYDEIRFGRMQRTSELVARLSGMIRASSNQDANQLLLTLGGGDYSAGINWLNQYIRNSGYSDATIAYNPFQDTSLRLDEDHVNQTSAADVAQLLERIYRRTFGTRAACEEAEELMLSQSTRIKIPAGLPDGIQVGNKTGETNDTENDAAVIYTPSGDYILTILSTGWPDKNAAQLHFRDLSAVVYSYFTDPAFTDRCFPVFLPR